MDYLKQTYNSIFLTPNISKNDISELDNFKPESTPLENLKKNKILRAMKKFMLQLPDFTEVDKFHNLDKYHIVMMTATNHLLFSLIEEGGEK